MWQKLKEQLPAIILTAALILGIAFWFNQKMAADMAAKQQAELALLREQTDAEMKVAAEETRRQIEAVDQLLKDAISKRAADVFMTDEEVAKLNEQKVNQLAEAIAAKDACPMAIQHAEDTRGGRASCRTSRWTRSPAAWRRTSQPILGEMSKDQNLTREIHRRLQPEASPTRSAAC
jgi:CRISPR/Cas system CMR-associated protein Cmr5 small subunit